MVTRRRQSRVQAKRKNSPRRSPRKKRTKSLKEQLLTTGIWAFGIANVILIISLTSNFFVATGEVPNSSKKHVPAVLKNQDITVEVLNACGVQGLAYEVTQYLREKKFDVVEFGNYAGGFDLDKTFVFDRVSLDNENARRVGQALGVTRKQITPQLDNSKQLMVTVLIGKDFRQLSIYKDKKK